LKTENIVAYHIQVQDFERLEENSNHNSPL